MNFISMALKTVKENFLRHYMNVGKNSTDTCMLY